LPANEVCSSELAKLTVLDLKPDVEMFAKLLATVSRIVWWLTIPDTPLESERCMVLSRR
jgi:hypothetical protein